MRWTAAVQHPGEKTKCRPGGWRWSFPLKLLRACCWGRTQRSVPSADSARSGMPSFFMRL
ncbi:MAG: hypothetical protein MZV64_04805 [Ignavibacteriales bacterium]|nr:hypothetical protein [Ignavibacteriales bacterium]